MNRNFTAPGELDVEDPYSRGADRRVEARRGADQPTDTEMLDWVLPILNGSGDVEADKRTHALMVQLFQGIGGRDAIRSAMKEAT